MPGLDPGIHAGLHVSMDQRVKPGGDEVKRSGHGIFSERRRRNPPISSLPGLTRQSMLTSGMRTFWVYILASRPRGTLYIGVTNNLIRRIYEHREGLIDGFTKEHAVKMLVYYEQHGTAMAAIQREKNIKHWSRSWKIDLIRSMNPDWRDLWEEITQ
jgi:putative endonuclease